MLVTIIVLQFFLSKMHLLKINRLRNSLGKSVSDDNQSEAIEMPADDTADPVSNNTETEEQDDVFMDAMDTETDKNANDEYPINLLPGEVLDNIFEYLDINSQKNCRLVSKSWNEIITRNPKFRKNIIFTYHHFDFQNEIPEDGSLSRTDFIQQNNDLPFNLHNLRINHLYCFRTQKIPLSVFEWLNRSTMKNVSYLELTNCQLKISHLLNILEQFDNLKELKVCGNSYIEQLSGGAGFNTGAVPLTFSVWQRKRLRELTSLQLHYAQMHTTLSWLQEFDLIQELQKLTTLDLSGDFGPSESNVVKIIPLVLQLLKANQDSLNILKLDNFPYELKESLDSGLSSPDSNSKDKLYNEWRNFLQELSNHWNFLQTLNLESIVELSLQRFPIAYINDAIISDTKLFNFLALFKQLRKLSISQIHFSEELNGFLSLLNTLPKECQLKLSSTHLYTTNINYGDIENVLHPDRNILKYKDTHVKLNLWKNISWKIFYCTWSSFSPIKNPIIQAFGSNIRKLEAINIQFQITDSEFQSLIMECKNLEELSILFSDLSQLTDYGLTGLKERAMNKLRIESKYKLIEDDFSGKSISSLTGLRVIKLGTIGYEVTNIGFEYGLLVMNNLKYLKVFQNPRMISEATLSLFKKKGIELALLDDR